MFNKSINYMKRKSFLAKASMMLLAVLFSLTGAKAQNAAPTNVAASEVTASSAKISWNGEADSYNLRYATSFFEDFENGLPSGWTKIDADGDGNNWEVSTDKGNFTCYSGSVCMVSSSYDGGALTPDNWLITPKLYLNGTLSVWLRGQDASWAGEHFAVYVSTTDIDDISDFVELIPETVTTGEYQEYTADLSAYAGQQGYIAIRHFNITDMFWLNVDDVRIIPGDEDWITVNNATSPYAIEGLNEFTTYRVEVQGVYGSGTSEWDGIYFTTLENIPTPTGLAVEYTGDVTATVTWTACEGAVSYDIDVNGTVTEGISIPYTLTDLLLSGTYEVKVRANYGEGIYSKWSAPVIFKTNDCMNVDMCYITYELTASSAYASYGWYGSYLLIYNADTDEMLDAWTVPQGVGGTATGGLQLCPGTNLRFQWYSANANNDALLIDKIVVLDVNGEDIINQTGALEDNINYTVDCTINPYKKPTNLAVSEVGQNSAKLSWTENGEATAWVIEVTDNDEEETTYVDVSENPYTLTGLTLETEYFVRVRPAGENTKWSEGVFFTTLSDNPVPSNIEADLAADGATLTWEGTGDSYNVQYRTALKREYSFLEDFENGLPETWTIIDADEDGYKWGAGGTSLSGNGAVTSSSYVNNVGALTPDNWLISPKLDLQGTLGVWMRGQDKSWAAEHFSIMLSTATEIADVSDFNITLVPETVTTGEYVEYKADLSAYAGQQGYIAIRHFNCTDMFQLVVDDFGLFKETPAGEWQDMAVTEATATLSGLTTNEAYDYQIQSVKGGNTSEWSEAGEFALLTLDSDADNTSLINSFDGKFAHVTLANRTLYKNGTWNTICLPFDLTPEEVAASPLADADIRMFAGITAEDYTATLKFTNEGALDEVGIACGTPYLVKWADGEDIASPAFTNVIIDKYMEATTYADNGVGVTFNGTYAKKEFDAENKSILFIGAENKLYWPLAGAKIGAMRGYFEIDGTEAEIAGIKEFILNLGDEDATGINMVENGMEVESSIYNLAGQKLSKMQKGINIVNGKKILK